jgi:hypothetical protein
MWSVSGFLGFSASSAVKTNGPEMVHLHGSFLCRFNFKSGVEQGHKSTDLKSSHLLF